MPNENQRPPLTLEQLLKLKRAERPDPEFWATFEVELRQKQLAALVQRRSWWQSLPQFFSPRAYLPIGATAILAFTLVSVRFYAPTTVAVNEVPADQQDRDVQDADIPGVPYVARETTPEPQAESFDVPVIDDRTAVAARPLSEDLPDRAGALIPWAGAGTVEQTPSARAINANLARLEEIDPDLVNAFLAGPISETSRAQQLAGHPMEMAAVSAVVSRRNRLLTQITDRQFTPDPSAPEVFRERLTRRLGQTELAGGWERVDLKSDRVSVKF
jgi:hypothetical protein